MKYFGFLFFLSIFIFNFKVYGVLMESCQDLRASDTLKNVQYLSSLLVVVVVILLLETYVIATV